MAERVGGFVLGFLVPVVVQWLVGWWLNSGRGVASAAVLFFIIGMLVARWGSAALWRRAVAPALGATAGSAVVLFWIGPGTIWPIVLVFAALISAASVFAGAAVVALMRRLTR